MWHIEIFRNMSIQMNLGSLYTNLIVLESLPILDDDKCSRNPSRSALCRRLEAHFLSDYKDGNFQRFSHVSHIKKRLPNAFDY